ncbi:MAG: hypothetical protein WA477_13855 [Candidatus Sulfotelmatobacter sp.]
MKSLRTMCAILCVATGLFAQTSTAPKPVKKKAEARITAADVQALRDAIASQQAALAQQQRQIQELRDEIRHKDQGVQQAQAAATDAATKADAAQSAASQQQQSVTELKGDVTDLKTNMANTVVSLQETQKKVAEPPTTIHFKGITISPGGFLAAETVRRSRALGADINTPFNSITMPGASASNLSEFFGSGRQSRISMLAQGKLASATLSGYYEADFLSAAVTSNNNESNSYSLRQRQVWGQAALDSGWTFTGGQMWSLVTETKHGVDNRTEALPMTIDPQYQVGFSWARQYGFRVSKDFNNKVWAAISLENPQATLTTHGNASNFLVGSAGAGGGLYNSAITNCSTSLNSSGAPVTTCSPAASYSFNPSPDVVAKLAFEPGFGHYEIFGVYSRFRDRVFPCEDVSSTSTCLGASTPGPNARGAYNSSKDGGGFGANARWTVAKHIDFGLHGFGGSGVGRYGTAGLPDVTVRDDGSLYLVRSLQGLTTLEWHSPKLDIYFNAGAEYAARAATYDPVLKKTVGYGSPFFSNSGCSTETGPSGTSGFLPGGLSSCTADTRAVIEGTVGFWHHIYTGPKGRIQWGPQYSYVTRNTWSGTGIEPHGIENMIFTSFRYYLP